jgi:hypothetical protein
MGGIFQAGEDEEEMMDEFARLAEQAILGLANALGVSAEFVWPILIEQALVSGLVSLAWAAGGLAMMIYGIPRIIPSIVATNRCISDAEDWHKILDEERAARKREFGPALSRVVISMAAAVAGSFLLGLNATDGIKMTVNPEYYALEEAARVVEMVKP